MKHVYLVLYLSIDVLILQPVKLLLTGIANVLWFPKVSDKLFRGRGYRDYQIDKKAEILNFNPSFAINDGDGFKFLAILTANLKNVDWARDKYIELRELLFTYIDFDGRIGRHPVGHPERATAPNFSGDMASGLLYWLAVEFSRGMTFSTQELDKLSKMFTLATFAYKDANGANKPALTFENVAHTGYSRGRIYSFFGLAQEPVRLLLWLKLASIYTTDSFYRWYHSVLYILYFPLLLVNSGDYSIFAGKFKLLAWYSRHSSAYINAAYILLTNSKLVKQALREILEKHKTTPSLYAIWIDLFYGEAASYEYPHKDLYPAFTTVENYVDGAFKKGTEIYSEEYYNYYDIKGFEVDKEAYFYCPPEMLGLKYSCEDSPIKPRLCTETRRDDTKIDWLTATTHFLRLSAE